MPGATSSKATAATATNLGAASRALAKARGSGVGKLKNHNNKVGTGVLKSICPIKWITLYN